MANNQANPLTAPLTMLKQVGEQASAAISSVGTSIATAASQGLDQIIAGTPPVPGAPGAAAIPGLPTPTGLMPANLQQAIGQVENLLIPPGLPRPSQALARQPTPTPTPTPQPTPPTEGAQAAPQAVAQRKRIAERRGL